MPKKFECNISKEELENIYNQDGMTLKKMCSIVGCKSTITMSKILNKNGINTNQNQKRAFSNRGNRTEKEFYDYLIQEYVVEKKSINEIARNLNVTHTVISRYFTKYSIQRRSKSEQQSGEHSPNWKGGRRIASNGYVEVFCPNHPNANKRKCVYEHQLIAEKKLGRYLKNNEVVHHIDLNKSNNSPDNLVVLSNSEHAKLHAILKSGVTPLKAITQVEIII